MADASLILAKEQTSGHGRRERKWLSPPGNIYASFIIKKALHPAQLTFIGTLSAIKTLRDYAPALQFWVKWPNDVYVNSKFQLKSTAAVAATLSCREPFQTEPTQQESLKIAGILSEVHSPEKSNKPDGAVIGIGINLNTDKDFFTSAELSATSIFSETEKITDIDNFSESLHENLVTFYHEASGNSEVIYDLWKKENILVGKEIKIIHESGDKIKGVFKDIAKDGSLILQLPDGSTQVFHSGEVSVKF